MGNALGPDDAGAAREGTPVAGARVAEPAITDLLRAWAANETAAGDRLFEAVYPELRRLARQHLARERLGISIQATELIHEAYCRLVGQRRCGWQCRAQFFAVAATMIRRILVDHAKHRRRQKRGAGTFHLSLDDVQLAGLPASLDVVAVDAWAATGSCGRSGTAAWARSSSPSARAATWPSARRSS